MPYRSILLPPFILTAADSGSEPGPAICNGHIITTEPEPGPGLIICRRGLGGQGRLGYKHKPPLRGGPSPSFGMPRPAVITTITITVIW
jgi:hypothetical protein